MIALHKNARTKPAGFSSTVQSTVRTTPIRAIGGLKHSCLSALVELCPHPQWVNFRPAPTPQSTSSSRKRRARCGALASAVASSSCQTAHSNPKWAGCCVSTVNWGNMASRKALARRMRPSGSIAWLVFSTIVYSLNKICIRIFAAKRHPLVANRSRSTSALPSAPFPAASS